MLEQLENQTVGPFRLRVETAGRPRFFDQRHFQLLLVNSNGEASDAPIFRGLYNAGRPSIYVPTWLDGEFVEDVDVQGIPVDLADLAPKIANLIGTLIPAGGRLWFAYEAFLGEGELARETRVALAARVPLLTTPIGFLLYTAGCWVGLRDWDIPEGGREGPRKMQGNKALNSEHARERAEEMVYLLDTFISTTANDSTIARAQERARLVVPSLRSLICHLDWAPKPEELHLP